MNPYNWFKTFFNNKKDIKEAISNFETANERKTLSCIEQDIPFLMENIEQAIYKAYLEPIPSRKIKTTCHSSLQETWYVERLAKKAAEIFNSQNQSESGFTINITIGTATHHPGWIANDVTITLTPTP